MLVGVAAIAVFSGCHNSAPMIDNAFQPGEFAETGGISAFKDPVEYDKLDAAIKSADFEFHLDERDRLTSMIPSPSDSFEKYRHIAFNLGSPSTDGQQFPGFVVVQLHKLAQVDAVDHRVNQVNAFFFSRGSSRVLVTGFRGWGRSIYSDKFAQQDEADHPVFVRRKRRP